MLGIEDYGSDSDSSLHAVPAKKRPTKKISIALPSLSSNGEDVAADDKRPAKKRKTGAGTSALLSMLPAPKESNPRPQPERILGRGSGPGLNFHSASRGRQNTAAAEADDTNVDRDTPQSSNEVEDVQPSTTTSVHFRPTSLAKGRKNISLEETNINQPVRAQPSATPATAPAVDFFSLGSSQTTSRSSSSETTTIPSRPSLSSAPSLPTFEPPEPTPTDSYPGYYQLPSGAWAAYEAEYYGKFMKKWEKEYNAHVRALEKGTIKGFEGLKDAAVEEIDALKEMEKAKKDIQEREARKAITQGAGGGPVAPKMNINASKTSGVARSRHQLSTLLKEAYENREALEERIAQGKRNRKEAGNKYGMCVPVLL
ncbi:hypothetical protein GALMADRAFT_58556 [Galerina marginata CBS 339.88]|uniref:Mitotic checkpoint regulator, MAD2B-interacting-domain-containing protein n=1 Tax=Galerina marginata (strain CBS 339.88) TaxID=685588 RepID=A0A067TH15_GALM3|nr:hypothetical protein GALMADRAFT_58556 [Galerina marginata CBS 339.88]